MKASELVAHFQRLMEEHGDLEVGFPMGEHWDAAPVERVEWTKAGLYDSFPTGAYFFCVGDI